MREAKVDNRIVVAGPSPLDADVGRVCYPTEEAHDPFGEETLERIKGDSFYGQTHVSLPEIERRLEETAETVRSPEQGHRRPGTWQLRLVDADSVVSGLKR